MKVGALRESNLWQFVIYRRPKDFPSHFVVRAWWIPCGAGGGGYYAHPIACLCDTLEEARTTIPRYADCPIGRHPTDDPVICRGVDMMHRFVKTGFGTACFRCGQFRHTITDGTCPGLLFPAVSEVDLEEAEDWVALPHDEERNILAVRAYLAGKASAKAAARVPKPCLRPEPLPPSSNGVHRGGGPGPRFEVLLAALFALVVLTGLALKLWGGGQ